MRIIFFFLCGALVLSSVNAIRYNTNLAKAFGGSKPTTSIAYNAYNKENTSRYLGTVTVNPQCGLIKGIWDVSRLGGYKYASFYDIPYAETPIGPLRFKDPRPREPFKGVFDATVSAPNTNQAQNLTEELTLNVYTKNVGVNKRGLHPVIVYISGGFFLYTLSHKDEIGPEYLLQKNVILVTFNYRCGALGFLSSDDPAIGVPGNAGLKDQVMVLRWVQKNIVAFGGDPQRVTVIGQSAGAASLNYHMTSQISQGLFHKAIMMSGSAFYIRGFMPKLNWAIRLARKLGWIGNDSDEASAFEFLRNVDVATIKNNEQTLATDEEKQNGVGSIYGPTLEAYKSIMCMIPEPPEEMVKNPWSHAMPLIIGGTIDEGLIQYQSTLNTSSDPYKTINENPSKLLPYWLSQDVQEREKLGEKVKQFYFGEKTVTTEDAQTVIYLLGDIIYWHGIYENLISRIKYPQYSTKGHTWLYHYEYYSMELYKNRVYYSGEISYPGVAHGDDLLLIFSNAKPFGVPRKGTSEYNMMQLMVETYTSFVINGNPNNYLMGNIKWEPVTQTKPLETYKLNLPPKVIILPEKARVLFWETLYADAMQAN